MHIHVRKEMEKIFVQMAVAIFLDIGWQFEAFRQKGLAEIDRAKANGDITADMHLAWQLIATGDADKIKAGTRLITQREQVEVLRPGYAAIRAIAFPFMQANTNLRKDIPIGLLVTFVMSLEAFSGIAGPKFNEVVPLPGNISDVDPNPETNDRWKWILTVLESWGGMSLTEQHAVVDSALRFFDDQNAFDSRTSPLEPSFLGTWP